MDNSGGPLKREIRSDRDWTKGSVVRNLWLLSWPLMIGQSLNQIGPTIDMIWVGRLSSAAIAGVGVAGMAIMILNSIMMALGIGARAIISRSTGAGDQSSANHAARQAYVVCFCFALIMVPVGMFFSEAILALFGVEPDVISEGGAYLRILLTGSIMMVLWIMTESVMQASGDSMTPMKIAIFFRLVHIGLCPVLIFGWWIFPEMGVRGAAFTNIITQGLGLVIGFWVLFTGRTRLHLTLKNFSIDPPMIWRIVRIGIPVSIGGMQRSFGDMIIMWLIVPFGTFAVAAHTIGMRVMMFVMMPAIGFGTGAAVLAGQNLGAGQPDRAERSGWLAAGLVQCWLLCFSGIILLWAEELMGIFGPESGVVKLGADFLRIATVGFLFFGLEPVLMSVLSGIGDAIPPMLTTVLNFWVIQIPLSYFLSRFTGFGVYGVRWGMVAGMIGAAVVLAVYFKTGRWKYKNV